jgi:hypothetical protein
MCLVRRIAKFFVQLAALFAFSASVALATMTIPAGTGTLTFTQTFTTVQARCVDGGYADKTTYKDTAFSYKASSGTVTSLSGSAIGIDNNCYGSFVGQLVTLQSTKLNILFDETKTPDGVVTGFLPHGYVNPKYVILGVTYAPPGPSSYVDYLNSTTLSSTTDTKATFSSKYQTSITTKIGGTFLGGWSAGVSTTSTSAYTQASFTSSSDTVSKTTSLKDHTPGPLNPYVGLNHDYDIIWLWLNPVQLFTLHEDTAYNITSVEWDGYGFSTLDQPDLEVYPVYVGWLNGDILMTADQAKPLQRAWAAVETWPSGQGPALTSTGTSNDFQAIVKSDPYWQCTPLPSACPTTVDGTRYTLTLNQDLLYVQAPVGGQPITQTYTDSYTQSSTQGQGASYLYSETFAWEATYGGGGSIGSDFKFSFGTTVNQSNTVEWGNQWDRYLTNSNTQTATASITGPPCVVSGSSCNPVYTKSTEFGPYEDNLYGTFMFFPLN